MNDGFDEQSLPVLLVQRSASLQRYVESKIPAPLRSLIAAEDVLQDVWIGAHRRIANFRPEGPASFDGWLRTIADNKLLDAIRAARTIRRGGVGAPTDIDQHQESALLTLGGNSLERFRTPSGELSSKDAIRAVRTAIESLSDNRRRAVWLSDIEGLSIVEVAVRMNRSATAVRSLLYQGHRQLRERVGRAASYFTDVASSEDAIS